MVITRESPNHVVLSGGARNKYPGGPLKNDNIKLNTKIILHAQI
jgi:hypothetical protein